MVARSAENMDWIRHIHLFHGLPEEVVGLFLEQMEARRFTDGEVLTRAGKDCRGLCFVRYGRVELFRPVGRVLEEEDEDWREHAMELVGVLERSDYYGEECVFEGEYPRFAYTARALDAGELYCWPLEKVLEAAQTYRDLAFFLQLVRASRRRAMKHRPRWLPREEMVYLFLGRPPIALFPRTWWLMFLAMGIAVLLIVGSFLNSLVLMGVGALAALPVGAGLLWQYEDWRNDYCVVTNQRVAWIDKVLFLYESRNEAPLTSVLSVNIGTNWWGRWLKYGNIIIRTYGGKIVIEEVAHPKIVATLIEEYWQRVRSRVGRQSEEQMFGVIRQRLGLASAEGEEGEALVAVGGVRREEGSLPRLWRRTRNWFRQRTEENGTVTYRKHWFLLLRHGGLQLLLAVGWPVVALIAFHFLSHYVPLMQAALLASLLELVFLLWLGYQVMDWHNDIYQLTPEQILDVYRKPFGSEDKQSAALESIENLTYERSGFLGWILNFGTVKVHVGTTTMVFEGVARPDMVQQEIFRYLERRRQEKQAAEEARESERVLRWLQVYHQAVQGEEKSSQKPSGEIEL